MNGSRRDVRRTVRKQRALAARGGVRWLVALASLALSVATFLASATAAAQNVTINTSQVKGGTKDKKRLSAYVYDISYADCMTPDDSPNHWELDIPVSVTGGSGTLELWGAETDNCASDISRTNGSSTTPTPGSCHKITLKTTAAGIYKLLPEDIVKVLGVDNCTDTSGQTSARSVTLYFLLAGSSEETSGTIDSTNIATYVVKVDLVGPSAPTDVTLDAEDGALQLSMPRASDADTQGYYVFVDPNPSPPDDAGDESCSSSSGGTTGTGGTTGAGGTAGAGGTTATGGAGGAGTGGAGGAATTSSSSSSASSSSGASDADAGTSSTCPPNAHIGCVDPAHPTIDSKNLYGDRISLSATSVLVQGLTNGGTYTVAIAAYDNDNNIGPLSVLQCGSPQATDTFFNQYCAAGGVACNGGCGSCTVGAERDLTWPGLGCAALALVGHIVRRDARRRRQHPKNVRELG